MRLRLGLTKKLRAGMRAKLALGFLVAILPAFLLVASSDYRHLVGRRDTILSDSRVLGEAAAVLVQAHIDQAISTSRLILDSDWWGQYTLAEISDRLAALRTAPGECLELFVLDAEGQVVASAPQEPLPLIHRDTLGRVASADAPVVSDLFLGTPENRPVVQVVVPIWSDDGFVGAAGVTLDISPLGKQLGRLTCGGQCGISVCDRGGWAVYNTAAPDAAWQQRDWSSYPHIRQALQGQTTAFRNVRSHLDGQSYLGAALPVPALGWAVTVWRPAHDSLGNLDSEASRDLLLLGGLGLIALVAALSMGKWFATPVSRLAQHARGLGRGQLNERIEIRSGDELEDLATALNNMARQIDERDRKLRARSAELEAIITQSADGIAIYGAEGELQRLNPAGIRILGRSPGLGLSLAEQVTWFQMRNVAGSPLNAKDLPVAAALRGETRVSEELRIEIEAAQERFVAFSASPLTDARGQVYGAVSIFRDMTHIRQAQQEKDDFVSVISHELKTPITSIKGYAQMLLRRAEERRAEEKELKGLRIINDEVDRMVDLINQILDVSRIETRRLELNLERVDLVSLASDAVDRLQMTTNRHTLRLRVPRGPLWVQGDAVRLAQVFGNLIMNAIKYSPAGGPIEVSLESQEGRAWVSVRDWGVGISAEDQPHLFQRFYRGKHKGSPSLTGMGLGLYISREIVQRHHGDIVFYSQPGQGTTFLFWLLLAN